MTNLIDVPSEEDRVCEYDLSNLALYAALLDAVDAGHSWQECAGRIMGLKEHDLVSFDVFDRHLRRARWIIAEGLQEALVVFSDEI